MRLLEALFAAWFAASLLVGCGGRSQNNASFTPPLGSQDSAFGSAPLASLNTDANKYLYVANAQHVTVYARGSSSVLRSISVFPGLGSQSAAFDRVGHLYVCNARYPESSSVDIYARDSTKLLRKIIQKVGAPNAPEALILDSKGTLFVSDYGRFGDFIYVYAPGKPTPSRRLDGSYYAVLAVNKFDDLFVSYADSLPAVVKVYSPGGRRLIRTISDGIYYPQAIALDADGSLYVANTNGKLGLGTITVYAPGSKTVSRTITEGLRHPEALAFDRLGNLYVASRGGTRGRVVTVYSPGKSSVLRTYFLGSTAGGLNIALSPDDRLFVADFAYHKVEVFARNSTRLVRTITDGVHFPEAIRFGP